MKTLPETDQV